MRFYYLLILLSFSLQAQNVIWQEAESLKNTGGWNNDSQHIDLMGSPYLLATGLGKPVSDAFGDIAVNETGTYILWVRCRDWYPSHSPGQFKVTIGGKDSNVIFGKAQNDNWQWVKGGEFKLKEGKTEVRITDISGWWGRVDAIVLAENGFQPAEDLETLNKQRIKYNGVSIEVKEMGDYDVIVTGGGPSGLGAAIAAGREGLKVAFIQDRPVLGGNASDEIMVPPMGHIGNPPDKVNVTGIAEEIFPVQGWKSFGSSEHYENVIRSVKNIDLFLNTRAVDVKMKDKSTIESVITVDVHTGQRMSFKAPYFIDTTGHGWIGYYAGADFRHGTEARSEFGESMAPEKATDNTMGNTLYKMEFRKNDEPTSFTTPAWAYQWKSPKDFESSRCVRHKKVSRPDDYDYRTPGKGRFEGNNISHNFSIEYGGIHNTIKNAEKIRDELFRINIGLWGYKKNYDPRSIKDNKNIDLVWLNYVPGVRESRRLMGHYIMTQKDFDKGTVHPDTIAFTDWGIDDHHPLGFWVKKDIPDTLHIYSGKRTSIPYRSLVSRNITNLLMAGRCMSVSHLALGGVRVMRPACATGQAAGTAVAICVENKCSPAEIHPSYIDQLQQRLLKAGCFLTGVKNEDPKDLARTAFTKNKSVIDGWNREIRGISKAQPWSSQPLELVLKKKSKISSVHLSLQDRHKKATFDVECFVDGSWKRVAGTSGNAPQRRYVLNFDQVNTQKIRFVLKKSSGPLAVCEVRIYENHGVETLELHNPYLVEAKKKEPVKKLSGIVYDENKAVVTGNWTIGDLTPVHGTGYFHDGNTDKGNMKMKFVMTPNKGKYQVNFIYTPNSNRASNTPLILNIDGKIKTFKVNQKKAINSGYSLGVFEVNQQLNLEISNEGTDGYVVVDGIQLVPIE